MQAGTQTYYCQYITQNTDFVFVFIYVYASVHGNQVQMQTGTYVNISVKIYIFISPVQQNLQIFCRVVEYWEMKLQILAPNNALSEKEAVNTSPIFFSFDFFFHISALIKIHSFDGGICAILVVKI